MTTSLFIASALSPSSLRRQGSRPHPRKAGPRFVFYIPHSVFQKKGIAWIPSSDEMTEGEGASLDYIFFFVYKTKCPKYNFGHLHDKK